MPVFEIEMNGKVFEVDAPSQEIAVLSLKSSMPTADEQAQAPTGKFSDGVMDAVKGVGSLFTTNPFTTVKNAINAQVGEGKKTLESGKRFLNSGDWKDASETVGHGLATALPLLGPAAAGAGEDLGTHDPRKVGRGMANTGMLLAPVAAKPALKAVPRAVGAAARAVPNEALPVIGAGIGAFTDGPRGFFEGAIGGSALERAMPRLRKLGLKGEEGAKTPTKPVAPRTTAGRAEVAPKTPKSPTAKPRGGGRDFSLSPNEEASLKVLEDNQAARGVDPEAPTPGNGEFGKAKKPPMSAAMDMEPDFLHQDVVRYPRPKGILRSDESVLGLAKELNPGVKALKSYPRPTGTSEQARALRQRATIAEGGKAKPKPVSAKGKKK